MAIKVLEPDNRGLMENKIFKGHSLFSNGIPNTVRPDFFGCVYVFNDDILYPESFLGMHPHENVEIVTIMISGTESHRDTLGIHENYTNGDVQLISSGTGVHHEGGNVSDTDIARHLQIWIAPKQMNLEPGVQLKKAATHQTPLSLLVSPDGYQKSLIINQDVWIYQGKLDYDQTEHYKIKKLGNGLMIYVISGLLAISSTVIKEGSTAFITDESTLELISKNEKTNFILIETII